MVKGKCIICEEITIEKEYSEIGSRNDFWFKCSQCKKFYLIYEEAGFLYGEMKYKHITLNQFKDIRDKILQKNLVNLKKQHKKEEKESKSKLQKIKNKYL